MHDTVIRGGTIVDGTGRQAFTGDVAINDGRIAEVGGKAGSQSRPEEQQRRRQARRLNKPLYASCWPPRPASTDEG